jgi:hypothetical protein
MAMLNNQRVTMAYYGHVLVRGYGVGEFKMFDNSPVDAARTAETAWGHPYLHSWGHAATMGPNTA